MDKRKNETNVVLIVLDSLRADYVSYVEKAKGGNITENLANIAKYGVYFSNCFAQGTHTHSSIASLLTSTYPLDYGGHSYLADSRLTIAEILRDDNYGTAAFHSNPYISRLRNFNKGFTTFEENLISWRYPQIIKKLPPKFFEFFFRVISRIVRKHPYLPASKINEQVIKWLNVTEEPFFLWVQYMDVHCPYLCREGFSYFNKLKTEMLWRKAKRNSENITEKERQRLLKGYRNEIKYLDTHIGEFLRIMDEKELLDNTLFIITADHGDDFGEHGRFGHENLPYNELIHVPLIFKFPPEFNVEKQMIEEKVRLLDIVPTILDFLDIQLDEDASSQIIGQSLLPLIEGNITEYKVDNIIAEKYVPRTEGGSEIWTYERLQASVMRGQWKFILDNLNEKKELYNLIDDPDEQNNLVSIYKEVAEELNTFLEKHLEEMLERAKGVKTHEFQESEETKRRLKDLGYLE